MLHGIPFCGLLGLRGEDMGLVSDVCLFYAFIFLVFALSVTLSCCRLLVWFGLGICVCLFV